MDTLADQIRACRQCEGMNIPGVTQAAPGYGSVHSPVVIVGESLCHACMASQEPFTGGAGRVLDRSLARAGIAKEEVFTTNAVHCHPHSQPRDNRDPHPHEITNCMPYLRHELEIVRPRLVIGLGRYARAALGSIYPSAVPLPWPFTVDRHAGSAEASSPGLLFPSHPYWVMTRPEPFREEYVTALALALDWGFRGQPDTV